MPDNMSDNIQKPGSGKGSVSSYVSCNSQNPISHHIQKTEPPQNFAVSAIQIPWYKIIEHLADTGIAVCAANIENLFEIAAEGMFSIICDTRGVEPELKKIVTIRDDSELKLDDLLILWLEKLLYIHETTRILFSKFEIKKLRIGQGVTLLKAIIYGEKIDLKKHRVFTVVKSPTYHKLYVSFDASKKFWRGQVIFDV